VLCNNRNECTVASGSYGDALLVAASAGALFAAVGCTVNGCEMPYECNPESKRCERLQCSEPRGCPGGYSCNLESDRCY
jgi:hypothetical protein